MNGLLISAHPTTAVLNCLDRRRVWLFAGIAVLLMLGYNGQWRIGPDSAIHMSIARSLAEGSGYTHPTGLEDAVRPGLALVTGATFSLFGVDRFEAITALMLVCTGAVLALTYWVVKLRFGRPTAVLIVCMLATNETFYRYGYHVLTDMPFLLGLMLLMLGIELFGPRGRRRLAAVACMTFALLLMLLFRSVAVVVVCACGLALGHHVTQGPGGWKRGTALAIAGLGLAAVCYWAVGGSMMRDSDKALDLIGGGIGEVFTRVFTDNGPELFTEHLPEALFGVDLGPWLGTPLGIIVLIFTIALCRVRPMWGLLVVVFVLQWLVLITNQRYILVLMPLLAIGWWRWARWLEPRFKPWQSWVAVLGVLVLWFVPNLVMVGVFIGEQHAKPFLQDYERGRYVALRLLADELEVIAGNEDIILADHAPQLTYMTRLPVHGPSTLPTYGDQRDRTLKRMRDAERILMVTPLDAMLKERITQLKLKQVETLAEVPTPDHDRIADFKIIQMIARNVDWENYHRRMEKRLLRAGAADQRNGESEQEAGQTEQAADQPE